MRALRSIRTLVDTDLNWLSGECGAIAVSVPLFLSVAIWNGFPLIFYDTGAYLVEGLGGHFFVERSPVYSLFLAGGGASCSLWLIVGLQALATAFVVTECARAVVPDRRPVFLLVLCAGLVIATGLPWYVGEIEPDCFASLAILGIFLLSFDSGGLGRVRTGILFAVTSVAIAVHASHILLALGLCLSLAVYAGLRSIARQARSLPAADLVKPGGALAVAVALLLAGNFAFTGQFFLSKAGPNFLFARLLQDRVVIRLLNDTCPQSGYRLCAYREVLPPTANAWLWAPYSPFFRLGGYEGTRAESQRIAIDSFERYPLWNLELVLADAANQFISLRTGDQVEPQQWALRSAFAALLPGQLHSYLAARQQRGELGFQLVNMLHVPVACLSLAALVGMLAFCVMRGRWKLAAFLSMILLGLAGNALICGALSNPHDRYQSRLIWLAPFAVSLVAGRLTLGSTLPQRIESGT